MINRPEIRGLLLPVLVGAFSVLGCQNGTDRPYIRIDDPSFEGHIIYDVAEAIVDGDPLLVAVGDGGSWISSDGLTWSFQAGPNFVHVITHDGEFFAVTGNQQLFRSPNGQDWYAIPLSSGFVYHISTITAGRLLAVGQAWNNTFDYLFPAVWISNDGETWEKHLLENCTFNCYAIVGESQGTLLVIGGRYTPGGGASRPRFWYSEDDGATWRTAPSAPFAGESGWISQIVAGENNVFYASTSTGNALLKSINGINWEVVEDPEVANSAEQFLFQDVLISGQSNVSVVVGSRAGLAATWGYTRTSNRWESTDASAIFGSDPPTAFTGVGISANVASDYVYTGYRTVDGTIIGAIWLRRPD